MTIAVDSTWAEPTAQWLKPPPDLLSGAERLAWRRPARWRVVRDLALIWGQVVAGIGLYVVHPSWWTLALGYVIVGGAQHGLLLAAHEFAHGLVIPDHKKLNDWIGQWLFEGPGGNSLTLYRHRHFAHHRLVSTPDDTKTIYRRDYSGLRLLVEVIRSLTGIDYVEQVVTVLRRSRARGPAHAAELSVVGILAPVAIPQLAIAAILIVSASPIAYVVLWALPLVTVCVLFSKIRSSVEHLPTHAEGGAAPDGGYFMGTPGPFVRTVRASAIERLFLCKLNFCYHTEHHLCPSISYQYLPKIHERLVRRRTGSDRWRIVEASYFSTLLDFWKGV